MLTGKFPGELATLSNPNYYNGSVEQAASFWQKLSPKLISLFNKMLAMHPEKRCSITEVHKYLDELTAF